MKQRLNQVSKKIMKKIKTVAGKKGFNRFPVFELIMLSNNSLPRCSLAKVINVPNVAIE